MYIEIYNKHVAFREEAIRGHIEQNQRTPELIQKKRTYQLHPTSKYKLHSTRTPKQKQNSYLRH
jgi:hypothetical protein